MNWKGCRRKSSWSYWGVIAAFARGDWGTSRKRWDEPRIFRMQLGGFTTSVNILGPKLVNYVNCICYWCSFCIVTVWTAEESQFDSWKGQEFFSPRRSGNLCGTNQLPIQWVLVALCTVINVMPRLRISGSILPLPHISSRTVLN
jgi:hypothetical protein